ncbi:DsbC family protein [Candidatus Accumulibacter sp. ACC007]|uniref:DsbC family protein n=1 Tax=Candidatus Accumulibacter sp. ACC007 TaxID=2823333 RepID=UPI0025BED6CA|nr:DsbC family protein [Candidatus Accumulibacter sp. ACC007]
MYKKLVSLALAATFSLPTLADEATVKKAVEAKLGGVVTSVTRTPYLGLYEVYANGREVIYTDEKVSVLLVGSLIDGKTMKNVTAERKQKLSAIKFSDLPLALAVKQVRGDGKRVFATFEDPNCGYCKRLAKETAKLENVTIYTFLYPILSPDSLEKSNQIWCSSDRAKAWNEWMIDGKPPAGKGDCDTTAVKESIEMGRKLAISGTPTIFFADGERIAGAIPQAKIEQKLAEVRAPVE